MRICAEVPSDNTLLLLVFPPPVIGGRHSIFWQTIGEVTARKRAFGLFLAMNHEVVQIQHFTAEAVVAVVGVVVAEVFMRDSNQVSVLLVIGEYVDGVGDVVCLDDQEQRRVTASSVDQSRPVGPVGGSQHRNVGQVLTAERCLGCHFAHQGLRYKSWVAADSRVGGVRSSSQMRC